VDNCDRLPVANQLAQLCGVYQVALGFGQALCVILDSNCIDGGVLKHGRPADSASGEFRGSLIEAWQKDHRVDRAEHGVSTIAAMVGVDLAKILIGQHHADLAASASAKHFL